MQVANKFFRLSTVKTPHETLATLSNGDMVAGYEGKNVKHYTHINYYTMSQALRLLADQNLNAYTIVETGCAAHGTKSTLLWDSFVTKYGGHVYSVDLNSAAVEDTRRHVSDQTTVTCNDSVTFLKEFHKPIDMLYLDSYDVDFQKPADSAFHHWKEFSVCRHLLHPGSLVLIDDTPVSPEWFDNGRHNPLYEQFTHQGITHPLGKGSLVALELQSAGASKLMHQYQMLWQVNNKLSNTRTLF